MYWGWVVDRTTMFQKVLATIAMFMLMFILLCDIDKHLARKRKQKREERAEIKNERIGRQSIMHSTNYSIKK